MSDSTPYNETDADWRLRVFDSLSFPTLILKPDRTILAANKRFYERNQTLANQVIGKTCKEIFPFTRSIQTPSCQGAECPLQRVLTLRNTQSVVHKVLDPEGEEIWEERVFSRSLAMTGR
jgi:two-component system, NtrC family, sensor kinase